MNEENHLYEYCVIRYVPVVERSEFINVGLLMMCKKLGWIRSQVTLPVEKISVFRSEIPLEHLRHQLGEFAMIAEGRKDGGPIAALAAEERFRWLAAEKSACIQTSRPHPGLTDDLDRTFERIYEEQVM